LLPGRFANSVEGADEFGSQVVQFAGVGFGEAFKRAFSGRGELEDDEAMVGVGLEALDEACFSASFAELDDAVMAEAEALGDPGDGGFNAIGRAGDLQHELVLLRVEVSLKGRLLAEV
jgi:hypothetical protein